MSGKCTLCKKEVAPFYDLCATCFGNLKPVRISSMCGPCLTYYRKVKENRTTITVAFQNGSGRSCERVHKGFVHEEPCSSCTDHPKTQYPNGYMD